MNMKKITCLIVLLLTAYASGAQLSAVLVMLKSERSRITHFTEKGDMENVRLVKQEREKVIDATMRDFNTHFNYCPVYYFMDTSLPKVLDKKFDGILLSGKGQVYETPPIANGSSNFLIVYYGIPKEEITADKKDQLSIQAERYPSEGLVILDDSFKRRKRGDHYLYRPDLFFYVSKHFGYTSKLFAMEYKPYASFLQRSLH
jgi:hypothetical protein